MIEKLRRRFATKTSSAKLQAPDIETEDAFDNVTRSIGSVVSRRESLQLAFQGIAAFVLWRVGVKSAYAQVANCLCGGMLYDPTQQCCIAGAIVPKNPIANLAQCPSPVAHPGHVCQPNGCGSDYSHYVVPNSYFGAPFGGCCNTHDCCYDACNSSQGACDTALQSCLISSCDATFSTSGVIQSHLRSSCESVANLYYDAVNTWGSSAWTAAQQQSCDCCGTSACTQPCQGSACGSIGTCAGSTSSPLGCYCFESTDSSGGCLANAYCAGLATCSSSADCPGGYTCAPNTCCGSQGVCLQNCVYVQPAPSDVTRTVKKRLMSKAAAGQSGALTAAGYE